MRLRIGPAGPLYDAPFQADYPAPERFGRVLDFVAGHGFGAYGLSTQAHLAGHFLEWRQASLPGIDVHYLNLVTHPLDSPTFSRGGWRVHASAALQARRLHDAATGGMSSYTILSPGTDVPWDLLVREAGLARDSTPGVPLHYMNGPPGSVLGNVETLLDFCRDAQVAPTLHAGNQYLAGHVMDAEAWSRILKRVDGPILALYGAYSGEAPTRGLGSFGPGAKPPALPLLAALRGLGRDATLLVQGDRPEADAWGVGCAWAQVAGLDAPVLGNQFRFLHRRVMVPS
ncbi:MAG: hypothetical protein ACYDBQ_01125 [Thermoplasmatota archaeon]